MPYKERLTPWGKSSPDSQREIPAMFKPDVLQPQLADTHYCNIRSVILNSIFTAHFEYLESQIDRATHQM